MVSRLWLGDRDSTHKLDLFRQRMSQLSRNKHRLFPMVSELHEVSCRGRMGSRSGSQVEWRRNPSHGSSWPFYSHAPGLTLVTLGTACVPSACVPSIWKLLVLPKQLRIRHIIHMSFGIILNNYSQGLSPLGLTLIPFSHLLAPNPFPSLWIISPPSLIHRVGLDAAVFVFY
jgi:hypothetical protein